MQILALIITRYKKFSRMIDRLLNGLSLFMASTLLLLFVWGGGQPEAAGLFKAPWDKLAHMSWFAVLAGLLHFGTNLRARIPVVLFCLGVGLWDEWRQMTLPGRSADAADLFFDGVGTFAGLYLAQRLKNVLFSWSRA